MSFPREDFRKDHVPFVNLTGNGAITATANAIPGAARGGNLVSGLNGFTAGAGGSSTASATGSRIGSLVGADSVIVNATATGEPGGSVLTVLGSGGNGGAASATAVATGNGPDGVNATATATGGNGGSGYGSGFQYGNGGNATANATATSTGGLAYASATAQGGIGSYDYVGTANFGITGVSTANASATGVGYAVANADATPLSPIVVTNTFSTASATARATGSGLYSFVQGSAVAPPDFSETAGSLGTINSPNHATAFPITASVDSVATVAAAPLAGDVTGAWALDSNVRNAFNNAPANVNALLLAYMLYAPLGTGLSHDYSSVLEINENNAQLTSNGLVVGLLTTQLTGPGLQSGDSLRFRIKRQGITLVDQTLSTNPALLSYLQNSVFDLGIQNAGLNGANLDVQFIFDLTTTHPSSGVGEQFVLGNDSNAQIGVWNNAAGGSWATPTNWSSSTLPDGPGVQATFGSVITMPQTVTLDESTTVGNLQFNNENSYTIAQGAGGGSLILDNAGAAAIINVSAGNHSISAPISLASDLNIVQNSGGTLRVTGPLNDSAAHAIAKSGSGTAEISGSPTLGTNTAIVVNGGTLRFAMTSGSPTLASGVSVAVNGAGTLELAGTIYALSSGSNRVNIVNSSTAPGLLVSGTSQIVGNIDGSGNTQVNAGSDLTANHIIQSALLIGGTAGSHGLVTIAASDVAGNPLGQSLAQPSGLALADSLTSNGPFEAADTSFASLSTATIDNTDLAVLAIGKSVGSDNSAPVPEPSTLLLALLALLGVVSTQFARNHSRR